MEKREVVKQGHDGRGDLALRSFRHWSSGDDGTTQMVRSSNSLFNGRAIFKKRIEGDTNEGFPDQQEPVRLLLAQKKNRKGECLQGRMCL